MNGYLAFYRGRTVEVTASTALDAQRAASAIFKARKSYQVAVVICQRGGETVAHSTASIG